MTRFKAFSLLILCALGASHRAQASDLRRLFAKAAEVNVVTRAPGALVRLTLPTEVLSACRADLSDLRLISADGVETPFVVDHGAAPAKPTTKLREVRAQVLGAEHHQTPRAGAEPLLEESYLLGAPPAAPDGAEWELLLEVSSASFVRRLDLESVSADGKHTRVGESDSVFRLKDGHGERLRVPLRGISGPRLRVVLTGEAQSTLEPRFSFQAVERVEAAPVVAVELTQVDFSTSVGRTVVQLARPAGIVPSALRLETRSAAFSRKVEVRDLGGESQAALLGSGAVFRVQGLSVLENLELPLSPARGRLLEVGIDDGDSPPLDSPRFSALIRAPSLVFSLADASPQAPLPTLYFGGGRAHAPRYDLATLLPASSGDGSSDRSRAAHSLFDPAQLSLASLPEIRENPQFDRAPALGFAQHPGAPLDASVYTHRRKVELEPSTDGVIEIPLAAKDLSLLREDLGDVRVIDSGGRQWPFLLSTARRDEMLSLSVTGTKPEGRASRSRIALPFTPVALNALLLDVRDTYFDRPFRLEAELSDGSRSELRAGRLTRAAEGARSAQVIEFSPARVRRLELIVEDGDNAPLSFNSLRARVPVPSLYVVAALGSYQLLLGNPEAAPASYDLENARSLVLSVASKASVPLGLEANPAYRATSRLGKGGGPERIALWAVLGAAVLLLGGLTFRLVQRESAGERADPS